MISVLKKISTKKRRGVSQIIGSLIVLALVASVGSVILFQGLNQINVFSYDLSFYDRTKNEEIREDLVVQHIRFEPGTTNLEIYLGNIGTVDSTVSTVTMIHNESQEMVLDWQAPTNPISIQLDESVMIPMTATLACPGTCVTAEWDDPYYVDSDYKISITTTRGNFVPTVATPWNT